MILRTVVVGLLLVTAGLLETSLFPFLALGGFRPDVLLLVVLAIGLRDGALAGLRVGFAAGLLSDLMVAEAPVGLAALVYTGIGFTVGLARPYLAPDSITAPVILAFLSGLIGTAGYGFLAFLLSDDRITAALLVQSSLAVALYNTLLAPIVIGTVTRLSDRFPLQGASLMD